ncbi:MAG: FtsQ-type POTRA domain-containing protein [Actinomycetota bacterium]|nr:FtsQ-type POTRA domain-containing protein [Actinomycetota bacterium]
MSVIEQRSRIDTDPRFSRRRHAVARLRRRKLLAHAAVVAGVAAIVWIAFFSPLLIVSNVEVAGGRHVTEADIMTIARLDERRNLLLLSTTEVAQAVRELAWVKRANIDRKLPGTLRVNIVERVPALALQAAEARWTIDRRGHVLAPGAPKRLPTVAGVSEEEIAVGERVTSAEVQGALAVYRIVPDRLRRNLEAIFVPGSERISLSLESGLLIRLGAAEKLRAKSSVLTALLGRIKREGLGVGYVDVRVPTSPAVGPAPTP